MALVCIVTHGDPGRTQNLIAPHDRMTLETRAVVGSHPGLAVLHGSWIIESRTETGSAISRRGLSTEVVRKQPDGTWLFVIDNPYTPEASDR
jgi:ketosteroid isomerase-like protein